MVPLRNAVALHELVPKVRPVALAGDERLAVIEPLEPLFPHGALRRGTTVTVHGSGALALAVIAGASHQGSWCAAVGMPALGLAAAAEQGIDLARFALVTEPGGQWATVAAALLDAVDIVLVAPPGRVRPADARRLMAKARERGAVLIPVTPWPEAADIRLGVAASVWEGLGAGYGRLHSRQVEIVAQGRGAAARERRVRLWLPGPDGRIASVPFEAEAPRPSLSVAG